MRGATTSPRDRTAEPLGCRCSPGFASSGAAFASSVSPAGVKGLTSGSSGLLAEPELTKAVHPPSSSSSPSWPVYSVALKAAPAFWP